MKHERFYDPRLSPQENKACEMFFNGFSRADIMDEMDISRVHLSTLFCGARRKGGYEISKDRTGPRASTAVPIERLVRLRAELMGRGFKGAGLHRVIAERVGLTENCVSVRLWKFDKGICPKRALEGQAA